MSEPTYPEHFNPCLDSIGIELFEHWETTGEDEYHLLAIASSPLGMQLNPGDWILRRRYGPASEPVLHDRDRWGSRRPLRKQESPGFSRGEQVNEWTAERLEALPDGTVIEACDQEFWLCPDGWLDGDGGCLASEDLIADTDPMAIRVISAPVDALLADEAILAAAKALEEAEGWPWDGITTSFQERAVINAGHVILAAIAHVTGEES